MMWVVDDVFSMTPRIGHAHGNGLGFGHGGVHEGLGTGDAWGWYHGDGQGDGAGTDEYAPFSGFTLGEIGDGHGAGENTNLDDGNGESFCEPLALRWVLR